MSAIRKRCRRGDPKGRGHTERRPLLLIGDSFLQCVTECLRIRTPSQRIITGQSSFEGGHFPEELEAIKNALDHLLKIRPLVLAVTESTVTSKGVIFVNYNMSVQAQSQPGVYKHSRRWPGLLILRALPTEWVPRSFAFIAKGGSRKCRRQAGLITVHNKIK